jgi:site-specific DNA-methyltransferase (adenine-specific)
MASSRTLVGLAGDYMSAEVILGDCLEVMPSLAAESFDAVITDPPYGLGFMGKHWDHGVPGVDFWTEARRVAKPGAYLLAFGGTRTFHRLTCAIEDAGFEIQDCLSWLYGSGFPKHKSKLKPAWEPIVMARKPAPKATLLNIDACRIETNDDLNGGAYRGEGHARADGWGMQRTGGAGEYRAPEGRWPANVVLDEESAALLDEQSGQRGGCAPASGPTHEGYNKSGSMAGHRSGMGERAPQFYGDSGGASRFFYTAKASRSERDFGLEGRERTFAPTMGDGIGARPHNANAAGALVRNAHPTVKPVELMRWCCRLVAPPGGLILDPFCGSGTTGVAATLEAFRFLGIEQEAEYATIARKRITETPPSLFGGVA